MFQRKVLFCVLGPIWMVSIFGGRMFIFTGQQLMIDKQLNIRYEWNLYKYSYICEACIHTYIQTELKKTPFCIHKDLNSVKPSKSRDQFLFRVTVFSHTLLATDMRIVLICSKYKVSVHFQNTVLNDVFWLVTESAHDWYQNFCSVCKWPAQNCYNGLYDWCCIQQWPEFTISCWKEWRRICEVIFFLCYMACSDNFWIVFYLL